MWCHFTFCHYCRRYSFKFLKHKQYKQYLSRVMRKPVFAICEQQRHRSACSSMSLISTFIVCCLESIIPLVSVSEISNFYLAFVAVQARLSLPWSQTQKTGFLMKWLILKDYVSINRIKDSRYMLPKTWYEPYHDKTGFCDMQTTKMQISLCINAVLSASVIHSVNSIKPVFSISKWSRLYLTCVAEQTDWKLTVMFLSFRTDRSGQTVQTDQDLHCLKFPLHLLNALL